MPENTTAEYRRQRQRERNREYARRVRLEALLAYGDGSCAHCGHRPDDPLGLELHHVNGDGAEHRAAIGHGFGFYRELKYERWPTDPPLATLCSVCHAIESGRQRRSSA